MPKSRAEQVEAARVVCAALAKWVFADPTTENEHVATVTTDYLFLRYPELREAPGNTTDEGDEG